MPSPFVRGEPTLKYVGAPNFQQKRQIGVPMVVDAVGNAKFETLFAGSVAQYPRRRAIYLAAHAWAGLSRASV